MGLTYSDRLDTYYKKFKATYNRDFEFNSLDIQLLQLLQNIDMIDSIREADFNFRSKNDMLREEETAFSNTIY